MQGHGQTGQQESDCNDRRIRHNVRQNAAPSKERAAQGRPAGSGVYAPPLIVARPPSGARLDRHVPRTLAHLRHRTAQLWAAMLPSACLICAQVQREVVCAACAALLLAPVARCPRCATPHQPWNHGHCGACADDDPVDATFALGDYVEPLDQLVLRLKFGARLPAAGWIARQLAARLHARNVLPDLLVPVPLSPSRLAERGFNQAWEITRPLARQLRVHASATALVRRRDTASQRTLDLSARLTNLHHAFAVDDHARLDGLHVGLVDDVMTTGATLREAARVLKGRGAVRVTALVALRTP